MSPNFSISLTISCLVASRLSPPYLPASSFKVPSGFRILMISRLCLSPMSKSIWSCAGVTFNAPEPNSISIPSSPIIGIVRLVVGTKHFLPIKWAFLSSLGFTATATSAGIVSGLVVATITDSPDSSSSMYFIYQNEPSSSSYSTSMSEMAERHPMHQLISLSARNIRPSSYKFLKVVRTDNSRSASAVNASRFQSADAPSLLC